MKLNKRFQLRLSSKTATKATIRCFVSVNAEKEIPFSTACKIEPHRWSQLAQRIVGKCTDEQKAINETLSLIDADIRELFNEFKARREPFSTRMLVDAYIKPKSNIPSFLEIWEQFLATEKLRIDNNKEGHICQITYNKYVYARNRFMEFMKLNRISNDIKAFEITKTVLSEYFDFLCSKTNFKDELADPNEAFRYLNKMEKVFIYAIKKDYLNFTPFSSLDIKLPSPKDKEIIFLTDDELALIYNAEHLSKTERIIVDGFIFMSYSSMTYSDFKRFANNPDDFLKIDDDGYSYILIKRYKNRKLNNQPAQHIPLIKILKAILKKYDNSIPVLSNQAYNREIKRIAHRVGVKNSKKITTYVGRKSAATYYINKDGVDVKTVAKILGHKHEQTTRKHYAVTRDETVKRQISKLNL